MVEALHSSCIACKRQTFGCLTDADATVIVLAMVLAGMDPEAIERDLCFLHRRHCAEVTGHVRARLASPR